MNRQKTKALLSAVVILMISLITPRARADIILTTLVSFAGANGSFPYAGLEQGSDGNFYGTTFTGGTRDEGTAFRVSPDGTLIAFEQNPIIRVWNIEDDSEMEGAIWTGHHRGAGLRGSRDRF